MWPRFCLQHSGSEFEVQEHENGGIKGLYMKITMKIENKQTKQNQKEI